MIFNTRNYETYYEESFYNDYSAVWSTAPISNTFDDIRNMAYYRAIGCFYQDDEQSLIDRRTLLYNFMKADFDVNKRDCALNRYKHRLPIDSNISRILRNICTAYGSEPRRSFGDGNIDEKMNNIYSSNKIDAYLKDIYKQAKLYGLLAVRPVWINGKLKIQIFTPDKFRVIYDEKDPRTAVAITYPIYNEEKDAYFFHYWDKDNWLIFNEKRQKISVQTNDYGVLPFAFLRFGYSDSDSGFYTPGMYQNVERQLLNNKVRFLQTLNITFQGLPILIGTNTNGLLNGATPDKFIEVNDVDANPDGQLPPDLQFIQPSEAYSNLEEFLNVRDNKLLKDNGIPLSSIEPSGTINSGVSRLIERQELIEMRYDDLPILKEFEETLSRLIALTTYYDGKDLTINPALIKFAIDYEEERVFLDPEIERAEDKARMKEGLFHPINYFQKWGDFDNNITEVSLIEEVNKRKELFNKLFTNNELSSDGQNTGNGGDIGQGSPDGGIQDQNRTAVVG